MLDGTTLPSVYSLEKYWYCIQSKPHAAFEARNNILRMGFEVILPTYLKTRKLRTGIKQEYIAPLFGNYLFVRFDPKLDSWRCLWNVRGVRRIFSSTAESPTAIPDSAIDTLLACTMPSDDIALPIIKPGCMVRVIDGPMMEQQITGICQWQEGDRIALLLGMMGGEIRVEFSMSSVELVPS